MDKIIKIKDEQKLLKSFRKYDWLFALIILALVLVGVDMFSENPRYIKIGSTSFRIVLVVFGMLLVVSLVKWEIKKKDILAILKNGSVAKGTLADTVRFRPNKNSKIVLHEFEYNAGGRNLKIVSKNNNYQEDTVTIVYDKDNPEKAFVFEHLRTEFKEQVELV